MKEMVFISESMGASRARGMGAGEARWFRGC